MYIYIYVYICLYVSEMNYTNFTRDRRNELGLLCHYRYLHYLRVTNMEDTDPIISMIILNINDLQVSINEWINKQDPMICFLQETHFKYIDK